MFNRNKKTERLTHRIHVLEQELEALNLHVESLKSAHFTGTYDYRTMIDGRLLCVPRYFHADTNPSAPTRECGDVTFAELARFVIDKKPIEREVTTIKYFEHPDTTQGSVDDVGHSGVEDANHGL